MHPFVAAGVSYYKVEMDPLGIIYLMGRPLLIDNFGKGLQRSDEVQQQVPRKEVVQRSSVSKPVLCFVAYTSG